MIRSQKPETGSQNGGGTFNPIAFRAGYDAAATGRAVTCCPDYGDSLFDQLRRLQWIIGWIAAWRSGDASPEATGSARHRVFDVKQNQPWSRIEREVLRCGYDAKIPAAAIADWLGRSPSAVRSKSHRDGLTHGIPF